MKKTYLIILSLLLFVIFIFPQFAGAATTYDPTKGLVPCGNAGQAACTINDFFVLIATLYDFAVKWIASPLAILMITIGAILMLISAGDPNKFNLGKKIVYAAIIGIILVFGALLIINSILGLLGATPLPTT